MSIVNRPTYEKLVEEDMQWLLKQPRSLEREHIECILDNSADCTYGKIKLESQLSQCQAEFEKAREVVEAAEGVSEELEGSYYASVSILDEALERYNKDKEI